jgi:putative ABC transport system permease protein
MQAIVHEMRQALSQLRHSPGFTVMAVVILGLGLGATLYMFTYVKAYMLTPLPYPHGERIMHIERASPLQGSDGVEVTQHDFVEWRQVQKSFAVLAAFHAHPVILADDEPAGRFDGAYVTPSTFDVTQVNAHIGRTLLPDDGKPGAPPVIVLGYDIWLNRYNGDPTILEQTIRVNGVPTTVVGVMPAGFEFPINQNVWLPLQIDLTTFERGGGYTVHAFGRLNPGVTLDQARADFASIAAALAERYEQNKNVTTSIKPFQQEFVSAEARTVVSAMFVSVLFVLLIACSNVANLMLARTAARQKDIAVRAALGAGRWRILVHVLTESVALASAGAVIAYYVADFSLEITNRAMVAADRESPFWIDLSIDWKVLAFGACAAIAAGVFAGLVPALRATRTDVNEHLKEGSKGSGAPASSLSRTLVTAEIALSCILLVCSGLMIRSVVNLNAQPLGIETANLLTGRIGLPGTMYPDQESRTRFFDELVKRLQAHPEALDATVAGTYPGIDGPLMPYRTRDMEVPASGSLPWTNYAGVMDNYADLLGIELRRGRWFDSRDHANSEPVVVIDEGFAREVFPGADPIGQQLMIGADDESTRWRTIVGVSEPLLLDQLDDPYHPAAFVPLKQARGGLLTVAVRTRGDPLAFSQALRETVFEIDRDIPVYWVRTLGNWIWAGNFIAQLVSVLFSIFAIIAVVLAAAGIYGVLAYSVSQRTREIGVRRALGAVDGRILNMVLGQGLLQLGIGLGIGLLCAVGFARLLSSMLRGVSPFDPFTLAVVALTLFTVAFLASLLPAWRALRVHPSEALRYE